MTEQRARSAALRLRSRCIFERLLEWQLQSAFGQDRKERVQVVDSRHRWPCSRDEVVGWPLRRGIVVAAAAGHRAAMFRTREGRKWTGRCWIGSLGEKPEGSLPEGRRGGEVEARWSLRSVLRSR